MITDTEKLNAVVEVIKGQDTKSAIAKKYNISTRSLGRYVEQFENQAKTFVTGEFIMNDNIFNESTESSTAVEFDSFETVTNEPKPVTNSMAFMVQQATVDSIKSTPEKKEHKPRKVSSTKKTTTPSIKQTVIDLMTRYKIDGKTTKEFREDCVLEIMQATGMERAQASKYYAGYKKPVFG